uniref:Uncharacterized protein n=1 Tax=Panagrolaimus superbus TaxID=310955 RepID=A0A914YXN0_9BILA
MLVELVNSFDEKKQKLYIDIASEMGFQLIIDENERSSVAETEEGNLLAPPKNDKAEANSLYDRFIGGNHVNDHDSVISASEQSIIGRTLVNLFHCI